MSDPSHPIEGRGTNWMVTLGVLVVATCAVFPTIGDFGLTWDEPAYRYSQLVTEQWWRQVLAARDLNELTRLTTSDALLYWWPYARFGINFHPPLAGQLNLLTKVLFGDWLGDIPARRLASAMEFVVAITILYHFLTRRYGILCGLVAAGSLLCMPRVYADAHLATTDMPGMLLWAAAALAFWNGLQNETARGMRMLVGVLLGLAFLEKMAAVFVLIPMVGWIVTTRAWPLFRRGSRADWLDGLITLGPISLPLVVAGWEVHRLMGKLPAPDRADLFVDQPETLLPGAILVVPLAIWVARRWMARLWPSSSIMGVPRPALEILAAILAIAPAIGWLGNPAWWHDALPRLAHYAMLNTDRAGALPDIRIYYLDAIYVYSLPWHNGWVLTAVTVPASILISALIGLFRGIFMARKDRLPLYLLAHFITIPVLRMFPTPAHDGVRLMLPTFFFLAAFSGLGAAWLASRFVRPPLRSFASTFVALGIIGPAAWQLVGIHPYELSYYNELVGGAAGSRGAGFELSYWYDAFNCDALSRMNEGIQGQSITPPNQFSETLMTFQELQSLGVMSSSIRLEADESKGFPSKWILAHDSKADPFSRFLFVMKPEIEFRPDQLAGLRVGAIMGPTAVARAWALQLLVDKPLRATGSFVPSPEVDEAIFEWARRDSLGLRREARTLAESAGNSSAAAESELATLMRSKYGDRAVRLLLENAPGAVLDAVGIIVEKPEELRRIATRVRYTDPREIGGNLDEGVSTKDAALSQPVREGAASSR